MIIILVCLHLQVYSIRNSLAHYASKKNLFVDDQTLQTYFNDIKNLVRCLEELQHFSHQERDDILAELDQVNMLTVFYYLMSTQGNLKGECGGHLAITYGGELLYLRIFLSLGPPNNFVKCELPFSHGLKSRTQIGHRIVN